MAPQSSTLAWKIPWTEEPGRLRSVGSLRVGHDWVTSLSLFTFMHWRRKWQPTPVFSWRIPGAGEPGGLPSMGSHRVGRDWSDLTAGADLYFELIFVNSVYSLPRFFFASGCPVVPALFVKKIVFALLYCLSFVKEKFKWIYLVLFWVSLFYSINPLVYSFTSTK